MSQFEVYFQLGFHHILDPKGYDHILFLVALCAVYFHKDLKKLLVLITAFTIGHSITLALAVFNVIKIPANIIETLIPVTIIITALVNVVTPTEPLRFKSNHYIRYSMALFFGLIHGLGFSNFLRAMLASGQIGWQLFSFNCGLEIGQILAIFVLMLISFIFVDLLKWQKIRWTSFLSGSAFGVATSILLEKFL